MKKSINISENSAGEFYEAYAEYNKILRGWLVGFGVGLPSLLFASKDFLQLSGNVYLLSAIISWVAIGIVFQILLALINKTCNWLNYFSAKYKTNSNFIPFRWAATISRQFWIDVVFDLISITSYAISLFYAIRLLP